MQARRAWRDTEQALSLFKQLDTHQYKIMTFSDSRSPRQMKRIKE